MESFCLSSKTAYQLIYRSKKRDWYVTDRGNVLSIPTGLGEKERGRALTAAPFKNPRRKKIRQKPGAMMVIDIGNRHWPLKALVVNCFTKHEVAEPYRIQHKDGNPANCSLNNLILYTAEEAREAGLMRKWKIEARMKDGTTVIFKTLGQCAKELYCDRSTLYDYLHGKVRDSCLNGRVESIRKVTEDEHG